MKRLHGMKVAGMRMEWYKSTARYEWCGVVNRIMCKFLSHEYCD